MEEVESGRNKASLRISSKITKVEEITVALGIKPDFFVEKDFKAVPVNPKSYVHKFNMWGLESDIDSLEPLDAHLTRLIEFIESRLTNIKKLIQTCEIDMFCGYFPNHYTGHLSLSPELLSRLTVIPIKIIIEMYPPTLDTDI